MDDDPSNSALLPAPRWLSRAEKADFRRLEAQRAAIGKPVSHAELDALADLCSARGRIADLRKFYRDAMREYRGAPYEGQARHALAVARQIDTATSAAQRQARRLGLGGDA